MIIIIVVCTVSVCARSNSWFEESPNFTFQIKQSNDRTLWNGIPEKSKFKNKMEEHTLLQLISGSGYSGEEGDQCSSRDGNNQSQ